eukprot:c24471_g1_i1 orf=399-1838(-)
MRLRRKSSLLIEQGARRERLVCGRVINDQQMQGVGMRQQQGGICGNEGNLVVVLNASLSNERSGSDRAGNELNNTEDTMLDGVEPLEVVQVKQEDAACDIEVTDNIGYKQGEWTIEETLILLEAKRKEQDMFSGSRRSVLTSEDRWKFVSDYCRTKVVQRSKEQCRVQWENMLPEYRKVREYEDQKQKSCLSYFDMEISDRESKLLPANMKREVYQRIDAIMSSRPAKGGLNGLKREAREKRFTDVSPPRPLETARQIGDIDDMTGTGFFVSANGVTGTNREMLNGKICEPERQKDAVEEVDSIGRQLAACQKRRKIRCLDRVSKANAGGRCLEPDIRNNSSTEEDDTIIAGRVSSGGLFVYEENAPMAHIVSMNGMDAAAAAYRQAQIGQNRSGNSSVARYVKEQTCIEKASQKAGLGESAELLAYIEERKDARHKELLALEREKLAAIKEASVTIVQALNNAISFFSKLAEDLLQRQ